MEFIHSNSATGHSGYHKIIQRAKTNFYWKGMCTNIKKFVHECTICQFNKHETVPSLGLLQPLPIPSRIWFDMSMDYIEGLPLSHGFSMILVVIDRLTKYRHFLSMAHLYMVATVAQVFLDNVLKLQLLLEGALTSSRHYSGFQFGLPSPIGWPNRSFQQMPRDLPSVLCMGKAKGIECMDSYG